MSEKYKQQQIFDYYCHNLKKKSSVWRLQNSYFKNILEHLENNKDIFNYKDKNNKNLLMLFVEKHNLDKLRNFVNQKYIDQLFYLLIENTDLNSLSDEDETSFSYYLKNESRKGNKKVLSTEMLEYWLFNLDVKPRNKRSDSIDLKNMIINVFIKDISIKQEYIVQRVEEDVDNFLLILENNSLNLAYLTNEKFVNKIFEKIDWLSRKDFLCGRSWLVESLKKSSPNYSYSLFNYSYSLFQGFKNNSCNKILLKLTEPECSETFCDNKIILHYIAKLGQGDHICLSEEACHNILKKSNINKVDRFGNSAFIYAVKYKNFKFIQYISSYLSKEQNQYLDLSITNNDGKSFEYFINKNFPREVISCLEKIQLNGVVKEDKKSRRINIL